MTTTDTNDHIAEADHAHDHPSDWKYVKIALLLGVITAFEVATYFWDEANTTTLVVVLFPMMIAKFLIVTSYFMHLKYDSHIFRRVFFFGLILAVVVFSIELLVFEFGSSDYLKFLT